MLYLTGGKLFGHNQLIKKLLGFSWFEIIIKKLLSPYRHYKLLSELFTKDFSNTYHKKANITVILSGEIMQKGIFRNKEYLYRDKGSGNQVNIASINLYTFNKIVSKYINQSG